MEIIHVRLRDGREDDIMAWYRAQEDKSQAVRDAIRAYIRLSNGESQEEVVKEAVANELAQLPDVMAGELAQISSAVDDRLAQVSSAVDDRLAQMPNVVAAAVRDCLAGYRVEHGPVANTGDEDPVLAANLEATMDEMGFGQGVEVLVELPDGDEKEASQ